MFYSKVTNLFASTLSFVAATVCDVGTSCRLALADDTRRTVAWHPYCSYYHTIFIDFEIVGHTPIHMLLATDPIITYTCYERPTSKSPENFSHTNKVVIYQDLLFAS